MKILSVFTHHQVDPNQTSMCLFVLLNTKKDIWKNVLIKQISFPIDYQENTMVVNGEEICLIKTFFQISSFVFSRTNKHKEVWNKLMVSKY